MNASTITCLRFAIAVLTLLALVMKPYIPPKKLLLHPSSRTVASIFAPPGAVYGDDYAWTDVAGDKWRCRLDQTFGPLTCGWSLDWSLSSDGQCAGIGGYPKCSLAALDDDDDGWGWENGRPCVVVLPHGGPSPDHPQSRKAFPFSAPIAADCSEGLLTGEFAMPTLDFGGYDGINIQVHYEGRAEYLRFYLRNYNPVYSEPADINTNKFMSIFLRTDDLKAGPMYVSLAELNVGEWWVLQNLKQNTDQQLAMPELDRIVSLGIDHVERGVHKMQVEQLELVGQRISTAVYLTVILMVWVTFFSLEFGLRAYRSRKSAVNGTTSQVKGNGSSVPVKRTDRRPKLGKTQAVTDVLTGTFNRTGVERQIGAWYAAATFPPAFAVIMLEVDQFSGILGNAGRSVADQLLQSFTAMVETNTREQDIFARWDDAVFVLLSRQTSKESLLQTTETLKQKIADYNFEVMGGLTITVSAGITIVCPGDTFHMALKRAEIALHKAREVGNRVVYEE